MNGDKLKNMRCEIIRILKRKKWNNSDKINEPETNKNKGIRLVKRHK
jgi:hypothetical protein